MTGSAGRERQEDRHQSPQNAKKRDSQVGQTSGVPAFMRERRIKAKLQAAACRKTRLATLERPRTCIRRN
jgi:hypothetical protein